MTEPISYRNQSIDLLGKSMDWFLYDIGLGHEGVKSDKQVLLVQFILLLKIDIAIYFFNLKTFFSIITEAVARRCSVKKMFLKISQNSEENTCVRGSGLQIY